MLIGYKVYRHSGALLENNQSVINYFMLLTKKMELTIFSNKLPIFSILNIVHL